MFKPKLYHTLRSYNLQQFQRDLMAGFIVALVAIPLAIAFAIASGVSPEKGLLTAIIAGFIISAFGGSRVQIGGPTGAFIVIVYGIVQLHGVNGLVIATFMAGLMLIIFGIARMGTIIRFIPYPLIVGFTSGIAVIIFSSEINDFLGMNAGNVPADFLEKWKLYSLHFQNANIYAVMVGCLTITIILLWSKVTRKIPGSLIAILVSTVLVHQFHLPVETIGSRFGIIPTAFPKPVIPWPDFTLIKTLIQPAFTIAILGGIESLLSAVVADGMIEGNHKSNIELVAQGLANMCSSIFGGIPATGAIARTITNVKNGGRTPIAGIVHAISLLLIMLFFGKWASLIPMATLAGILIIVAWNMSEWKNFLLILKGSSGDVGILITTFLLTVLVDLTAAIEIGMVLASFLFLRNMIKLSDVRMLSGNEIAKDLHPGDIQIQTTPGQISAFEISGPFFFGGAYKLKEIFRRSDNRSPVVMLRMAKVSLIDATGIKALRDLHRLLLKGGRKLLLSEVGSLQVMDELKKSGLFAEIGKDNIT